MPAAAAACLHTLKEGDPFPSGWVGRQNFKSSLSSQPLENEQTLVVPFVLPLPALCHFAQVAMPRSPAVVSPPLSKGEHRMSHSGLLPVHLGRSMPSRCLCMPPSLAEEEALPVQQHLMGLSRNGSTPQILSMRHEK